MGLTHWPRLRLILRKATEQPSRSGRLRRPGRESAAAEAQPGTGEHPPRGWREADAVAERVAPRPGQQVLVADGVEQVEDVRRTARAGG